MEHRDGGASRESRSVEYLRTIRKHERRALERIELVEHRTSRNESSMLNVASSERAVHAEYRMVRANRIGERRGEK